MLLDVLATNDKWEVPFDVWGPELRQELKACLEMKWWNG